MTAWEIDLDGVGVALENGARAVLLCSPHNPTGTVHPAASLAALAELAATHGAVIVSDEIHAPLAQPDAGFMPFLAVSDAAREVGYAVVNASKAFNLAGLKCALMVTASDGPTAVVRSLARCTSGTLSASRVQVTCVSISVRSGDTYRGSRAHRRAPRGSQSLL